MAIDDGIADAVGDAELLPHLTCRIDRDVGRRIGEPLEVGIAQHQESTRTDEGAELVVVVGQLIDAVAMEVLLEAFEEPVVIGPVEVLDTFQFVGDTPRGCTSSTWLLGNGEGDTLVEGATEKRHLAGVGTTRHADVPGVDFCHLGTQLLQAIDEAAQAPRPFAVGTVVDQVGIEAHEVVFRAVEFATELRIAVYLTLVIGHQRDGASLENCRRQRDVARANHQRIGSFAHRGIGDQGAQGERLTAHRHIDDERIA